MKEYNLVYYPTQKALLEALKSKNEDYPLSLQVREVDNDKAQIKEIPVIVVSICHDKLPDNLWIIDGYTKLKKQKFSLVISHSKDSRVSLLSIKEQAQQKALI